MCPSGHLDEESGGSDSLDGGKERKRGMYKAMEGMLVDTGFVCGVGYICSDGRKRVASGYVWYVVAHLETEALWNIWLMERAEEARGKEMGRPALAMHAHRRWW